MTPASPAARRLSLLGCLAAAALALALSACGAEEGTAAPEEATATRARAATKSPASAGRCQPQVSGFLESMDSLRKRLDAGVTYGEYVDELGAVRSAYDEIPVERLQIGCLTSAGSAAERALNEYIDAANTWGECLSEAGCDAAAIEPRLQGEWRVASHFLSAAQSELRSLRTPGG
jgi:hypothetical protein